MFALSIAFCDEQGPHTGVVYDPMRDEMFIAERGLGLWLGNERAACSRVGSLGRALIASALPFRFPQALDDCMAVFGAVQRRCDDQRRSGSAALDLAYTAVGRLDAYYELGYRAGADGQQKTEGLLRAASSLLEDLLLLKADSSPLVRNIDLQRELGAMADAVTFDWIETAARGLRQVESGMRRNLLRSLALDSFAAQLSGP